MIRINLLDDIKVVGNVESYESVQSTQMDVKQAISLIIKIVFILLPSLSIFGWISIEKSSKEQVLNGLKTQEQEILAQLTQQNQQYEKIKDLQKEKLELDQVVASLSQAAIKRTVTLKSLDILHSIVPDQAWLTRVEVLKDNKVVFAGEAKPSNISVFIDNLNQQPELYRNVNLIPSANLQSNGKSNNNEDDYVNFEISAELVIDQEDNLENPREDTASQNKDQKAGSLVNQGENL